ncbi:MAG: hypothetical protein QG599_926 [Pseudomonadota bacterium]|nr:hypothetical protein [Pseudomonadota bacterium]
MNSQHSTKRLTRRDATLAAALTVAGIGGLTTIVGDPCAIVRAARFLTLYRMSMRATDPAALAAYCAWSAKMVMIESSIAITHLALCNSPMCPLDSPVAIDPTTSGMFINPPPVPTAGRLWRMRAEY